MLIQNFVTKFVCHYLLLLYFLYFISQIRIEILATEPAACNTSQGWMNPIPHNLLEYTPTGRRPKKRWKDQSRSWIRCRLNDLSSCDCIDAFLQCSFTVRESVGETRIERQCIILSLSYVDPNHLKLRFTGACCRWVYSCIRWLSRPPQSVSVTSHGYRNSKLCSVIFFPFCACMCSLWFCFLPG